MSQKENKILKYCSNKRLARILTKASKEDVCRYYIDEDLDRADVFKKLNITSSELDVILDYFNIKKDMSTRMKKTRKRQLENMTPEKAAKIKQKELATKAAKSPEAKAHIKNKELETKRKLKEKDPYKYQEIQNRRNATHSKTLKSKNKEYWLNRSIKFKESIKKSIPKSVIKNQETKRKNNTFSTSKVETFVVKYLETLYSIVKQYKSDSYPFNCDVYIKDLDIYVEVNGHWTHGKNIFNPQDKNDIEELNNIRKKQKYYSTVHGILKQNSYFIAEKVWTQMDPLKLNYAKNNNLTYVVLYNINETNKHYISKIDFKKIVNTGINIIDMSCINQLDK